MAGAAAGSALGQRRRNPPGGVDVEFGSTGAENSRLKNAFENCGTNFGVD